MWDIEKIEQIEREKKMWDTKKIKIGKGCVGRPARMQIALGFGSRSGEQNFYIDEIDKIIIFDGGIHTISTFRIHFTSNEGRKYTYEKIFNISEKMMWVKQIKDIRHFIPNNKLEWKVVEQIPSPIEKKNYLVDVKQDQMKPSLIPYEYVTGADKFPKKPMCPSKDGKFGYDWEIFDFCIDGCRYDNECEEELNRLSAGENFCRGNGIFGTDFDSLSGCSDCKNYDNCGDKWETLENLYIKKNYPPIKVTDPWWAPAGLNRAILNVEDCKISGEKLDIIYKPEDIIHQEVEDVKEESTGIIEHLEKNKNIYITTVGVILFDKLLLGSSISKGLKTILKVKNKKEVE